MFTSADTPLFGARSSREIRQLNEQFVLTCLRQAGPLTRQELAARLGVTPMAIGRIVSGLLQRGIVLETRIKQKDLSLDTSTGITHYRNKNVSADQHQSSDNKYSDALLTDGRGRPRTLVRLNPDWVGLGIDFRVHKAEVVLVDILGQELNRFPLGISPETTDSPEKFIANTVQNIEQLQLQSQYQLGGVGIGIAGLLDSTRKHTIRSHYLGWNSFPLVAELEQALNLPVGMRHIAECGALANTIQPETSEANTLLHIQIGVGLGVAVIRNQDLSVTRPVGEGEPGHAPMFENTHPCVCGRKGCVDTVIGFDAFARGAETDLPISRAEMDQTAREIANRARRGEPRATSALNNLKTNLARLVTIFTVLEAADGVTIGGYPLALGDDFMDEVSAAVSELLQAPSPLISTHLRDDAPGYGAAMLGLSQLVRI